MVDINLFKYKASYKAALKLAKKDRLVKRIWARDHRIWSESEAEISNRLGWLDIAEHMKAELPELTDFAEEIKNAGIEKVLILGMGGSSLAPDVFSRIFTSAEGFPELNILDSTDPGSIRSKMRLFDPEKTLYIVSTKSGGTIETVSFFKLFYNQCRDSLGAELAGDHFVAITDPNSSLADIAAKYSFRKIFLNDANIGGRYSALSYFGLLPAALLGMDLDLLLDQAIDMAQACQNPEIEENPGAQLGISMGVLAKHGVDKLAFIADENIAPFGDWAEQLIAESTGKSGKGILPLVNRSIQADTGVTKDQVYVLLGKPKSKSLEWLKTGEIPHLILNWANKNSIGAQIFLWEFATAVACHILNVHPFNQPNVESAKIAARTMVDLYISDGQLPENDYVPMTAGTIKLLLEDADKSAYVALQAYTQADEASQLALRQLQDMIEKKFKLATSIGFGPRFLHSTGQLHKGDSGKGIFVQLISDGADEDVAIPNHAGASESQISFDTLKHAQAAGDATALNEAGRKIISFHIMGNFPKAIEQLLVEMKQ